jgi:hypothetical protein
MKRKQGRLTKFVASCIDLLPFMVTLVVCRAVDGVIKHSFGETASWTFAAGFVLGIAAAYFWAWGPRRDSE